MGGSVDGMEIKAYTARRNNHRVYFLANVCTRVL